MSESPAPYTTGNQTVVGHAQSIRAQASYVRTDVPSLSDAALAGDLKSIQSDIDNGPGRWKFSYGFQRLQRKSPGDYRAQLTPAYHVLRLKRVTGRTSEHYSDTSGLTFRTRRTDERVPLARRLRAGRPGGGVAAGLRADRPAAAAIDLA